MMRYARSVLHEAELGPVAIATSWVRMGKRIRQRQERIPSFDVQGEHQSLRLPFKSTV